MINNPHTDINTNEKQKYKSANVTHISHISVKINEENFAIIHFAITLNYT